MDMMQIIEMLRKQSQQNQPLMPQADPYGMQKQSFDFASSPFPSAPQSNGLPPRNRSDVPPAPAQVATPPPAPQPDLMGPHELVGPTRDLAGPMGIGEFEQAGPPVSAEQLVEVENPHEKRSHIADQPFYKDNDRMAMMAAALSEGFGGMTLRGKTGMSKLNQATFAKAQKDIQDNKTYDYLLQNNPEMAKVMTEIPPEYRGQFMELYQKSLFSDVLDDNSTADIRNYKFRESLSPEDRKVWDNQKTGEKMIPMPDGSVIGVSRDGTARVVVSSEDSLRMTAQGADAEQGGKAAGDDFRTLYKAARYAQDNLDSLQRTKDRLVADPEGGGILQPIEQFMNRVKAEFGSIEGAAKATNEQLLQMEGIERTMQWFLTSGLGARGLDTPAEFIQWLRLNGGDLTMTRDASIAFIDRAMTNTMRAADRYNAALTDPIYRNVDSIGSYSPVEYTNPLETAQTPTQPQTQQGGVPAEGTRKEIAGQTYIVRNGKWETL